MSDTKAEKRPINWSRIARNASAGTVASIAGYASYWHQVHVATLAGERTELAHIIPLSVDGVLVVASIAMVDAGREGRKPSWATRVGFVVGIAASIGANVMSAQPTLLGRAVAAWPAVALLLVVEMLSRKGKLLRAEEGPAKTFQPAAPAAAALVQPSLPAAPTSPAPVGRPPIPAVMGPNGRMVHAETGESLKVRTETRKRRAK